MDKNNVSLQMEEVLQIFRDDIATIRTGRATPALIEGIEVSVYQGQQKMRLVELGSILTEGARSLVFQPWDRSIIKEIRKGIASADPKLNPVIDGEKIRINLPPLTTSQRQDYVKLLHKKLEGARVMIRNIRGRIRHQLQEDLQENKISEDEYHQLEDELQKLTDEYVGRLGEMAQLKEKEIEEV